MSGLGKGVVSSSICKLLQLSDQKVSCIKIDPYLNYDAGTMNPIAHGEVFVTDDGGECDMDIWNFFFFDKSFTKVVLPAPDGDDKITIIPSFFMDI